MTFGLLGIVAVLVTALRAPLAPAAGRALPPPNDQAVTSKRKAEAPFDLSRVPADAVGVLAFRPSSLAGNEVLRSLLTLAQSSSDWKPWFAKAATAGLALESIEQVIYVQLKADLDTVRKDEISILRKGALIVKSRSAIDAKAASEAFKEIDGKYRLSLMITDDRTAIIGDEAAIKHLSNRAQGVSTKYTWSDAWSGVERSQVALAFDAAYVRGTADPLLLESGALELMMFAAPAAPIWEGASSMSLGLSIVGDQVEIVSVNVAGTVEAAETTHQTDQALLTLARNAAGSLTRQLRKVALAEGAAMQFLMIAKFADLSANQILQQTRVERADNSVRFTTKVDLDTLLILTQVR
jgi:hypothetical protein